jgi:hypothetical protein
MNVGKGGRRTARGVAMSGALPKLVVDITMFRGEPGSSQLAKKEGDVADDHCGCSDHVRE